MEYVELKTTENSKVYFLKQAISAIEEVPQTARTEGFLRVYSAGYKFGIKDITAEELLRAMQVKWIAPKGSA